MAGIYIHIPFCRRACHYCDFHFTTNLKNSENIVDSILKEIKLRKYYLEGERIATIYFGGGTPTLLPTFDLARIINQISKLHTVVNDAEITVEANPEDLSPEKLNELREIGVNRLSLGTQSFIDAELKWMNRMHSSSQAVASIKNAQDIGFKNISIDLIFGLPHQQEADWEFNLDKSVKLDVQHVSSYGLTIEKKTVLEKRISQGVQAPPDESMTNRFLRMNMEFFPANGFEHYETSNYALEGFISRHNSSYWKGENYIGLGPSAHSFDGISRQWNIKSNAGYISALESDKPFF
jgi:oxygen-independent coproporphyrinogen-3 oxidase